MLKFIIKPVDYKHQYYSKGWHLPIYTVDDDSLSLLTRCRRVALVHELLWLTVGWSKLANRAIRLDRSSSSIEWTSVESSTTKTRLQDLSKKPSSSTNTLLHNITGSVASCYKFHGHSIYLRPLNNVVLFTTNVSFQHSSILPSKHLPNCRPWRLQLVMVLWLNSQQNRLLQCKQSHEANASKRVRPFIGASNFRSFIYNNITWCQLLSSFT